MCSRRNRRNPQGCGFTGNGLPVLMMPDHNNSNVSLKARSKDTMKTCNTCQQEKPLEDFPPSKQNKDGRITKCRVCTRKSANERRKKNLLKRRIQNLNWSKKPSSKLTLKKSKTRWRINNKHKIEAHRIVWKMLQSGRLFRLPCCMCGEEKNTVAHHDDYEKPLEVKWLCHLCHIKIHRNK